MAFAPSQSVHKNGVREFTSKFKDVINEFKKTACFVPPILPEFDYFLTYGVQNPALIKAIRVPFVQSKTDDNFSRYHGGLLNPRATNQAVNSSPRMGLRVSTEENILGAEMALKRF